MKLHPLSPDAMNSHYRVLLQSKIKVSISIGQLIRPVDYQQLVKVLVFVNIYGLLMRISLTRMGCTRINNTQLFVDEGFTSADSSNLEKCNLF